MRIRTAVMFVFIFITWYVLYQALYSWFISIVFVLSLGALLYIISKAKKLFTFQFLKPSKKRILTRSIR
jgi:hypothetical protein